MARFEEMSALLQKGKAKELTAMIQEELAAGTTAQDILNNSLMD